MLQWKATEVEYTENIPGQRNALSMLDGFWEECRLRKTPWFGIPGLFQGLAWQFHYLIPFGFYQRVATLLSPYNILSIVTAQSYVSPLYYSFMDPVLQFRDPLS